MKNKLSIFSFIVILTLLVSGCTLPTAGGPEEFPQEDFPPEEFPPEEFPPEDMPPEEFPPEEHPPEEMGGAEIIFFEVHPDVIGAGDCAMLEWGVEGMAEVTLDGEPVDMYGNREVCPGESTGFHLVAHSENSTQEREAILNVEGAAQPQPQPQPTSQSKPKQKSNPTPTMQMITLPGADLALTDLYADKLKNGTVYARITNHGPDKVTNLQLTFSCKWAKTAYTASGGLGVNESSGSKKITITSLAPGQTTPFNTSVTVDLTQFWYNMTCTIQVPFANLNSNTGNDSYTEKLAK